MCPAPGLRAVPRDISPGWGARRGEELSNQKEANPHVPVSASCWD